jgi:hypothetical protein
MNGGLYGMTKAGCIYCVWEPKLELYTAVQITHVLEPEKKGQEPSVAVLLLDWTGSELPAIEELQSIKPLIINFYFWNDRYDHYITDGPVPSNYIYIGELPVLVENKPNSYSGWHGGSRLIKQLLWNRIPEDKRNAFKAASQQYDAKVLIGEREINARSSSLYWADFPNLADYTELDKLPCLTTLVAPDWNDGIAAYLRTQPFLYKIELGQGADTIDLTCTAITEVALNIEHTSKLILPENMESLRLSGLPASGTVTIRHEGRKGFCNGKGMTLRLEGGRSEMLQAISGLDELDSLELYNVSEADAGEIVSRFPDLTSLRLWGKPGYIRHLERLSDLPKLEVFATKDMFGFQSEDFPKPEQLPKLYMLWMTSLPEDAAKSIKQAYKNRVKQGLDLSIKQPRKPEWLPDNLDNPLRSWDGREGISPALFKKAASLYRQLSAQARALTAAPTENSPSATNASAEGIRQSLETMLGEYVEGFNKLDRRHEFIYTEEREEIMGAAQKAVKDTFDALKSASFNIDEHAIWEHVDGLRDF